MLSSTKMGPGRPGWGHIIYCKWRKGQASLPRRAAAVGGRGWPPFLHPRISSTRALERFRNQLALRRVAQRVWHDVVDIFEDCHQLFAVR